MSLEEINGKFGDEVAVRFTDMSGIQQKHALDHIESHQPSDATEQVAGQGSGSKALR